jgi:hypothetical protein
LNSANRLVGLEIVERLPAEGVVGDPENPGAPGPTDSPPDPPPPGRCRGCRS